MTSLKMDGFASKLQEATTVGANMISPGIVCTVVDDKGNEIYQSSNGTCGLHSTNPIHPETLMWIASETKLVGAVCAMKIVEDGLWSLDDPVEDIVPELKGLPVVDEEGNVVKEHAETKITLRHLLTHTSGMVYPPMHPGAGKWRAGKNLSSGMEFFGDKQENFPSGPLIYEPGSGWSYGPGIDWAGFLASRVVKKPLGEYMQETIFKPLGMTSTTLDPSSNIEGWKDKLMGMTTQIPGGAGLLQIDAPTPVPPSGTYAGHGLFSTPSDYRKFLTMVLCGGQAPDGTRVLKKESVDEMFRPQLSGDDLKMLQASAEGPLGNILSPGLAAEEGDSKKVNYGLSGLINLGDCKGRRKAGSMCWGGMPNLVWWIDRKSGVAGNMSTQLLPAGADAIVDFVIEFEKEVYKELVA